MINAQIGPREDYSNVLITLAEPEQPGQPYRVLLDVVGWRMFPPGILSLSLPELAALEHDPVQYGLALGKALFDEAALGRSYGETLAVSQGRGDGLRVRLDIIPSELASLHWERLHHLLDGSWRPLPATAITPFSRYVQPQQWQRPQPITRRPLRVLVVIASPDDLSDRARLDPIPDQERASLHHLFDGLAEVQPSYLESGSGQSPTLTNLGAALTDGYDFVHFLCHGARGAGGGTALFLEDELGKIDAVTQAELLGTIKAVQNPPIFCFLTACESAARTRSDAFLPLGPALVEDGGLQAVVAMTGRVGFSSARKFTTQFYTRLLKHGVVDLAMNEARILVQGAWDWGVPALFSRLIDNQLLDFPVGQLARQVVGHSERAFGAVDQAIEAARFEEHGGELIAGLEELVDELRKTHGALVQIAGSFRRTGEDPKTFRKNFRAFYYQFKDQYDNATWVDQQTSASAVIALRARILPRLAPILPAQSMDALRQELDALSSADQELTRYFQTYMDQMNTAVEQIWALLNARKVRQAITAKQDFEAQISPGFQRSKQMFERMGRSIHVAQAA